MINQLIKRKQMPIVWRYLLKNYIQVFLLCVIAFISILLVTRLHNIAELAALNTPFALILLFVLCQIPYILPIAIPIAGFISSLLLFQKLSITHECTALRSSGLTLNQIIAPILFAACSLCLINFLVVSEVTPRARLCAQDLFYNMKVVNPLFLMKKSYLLNLKDAYVDMSMTDLGKEATNVIFAIKNERNNRLSLITIKKCSVENNLLIGKKVGIISNIDTKVDGYFDHLIIENQVQMSTAASTLSQFIQTVREKVDCEYLPLNKLYLSSFSNKELKPKKIKRAQFELCRRFYFSLLPFAFTLMGISFGMQIGRNSQKWGFYFAICLVAFTLICSMLAKSFFLHPVKAAVCYFFPFLIMIFSSLWVLKRVSRGIE